MRLLEDYQGMNDDFFKQAAERSLKKFNEDEVYLQEGIVRWKSNGAIPPEDILELWHFAGCNFDYQKTVETGKQEIADFLEDYRNKMKDYQYTEEELRVLEAEFGKGNVVIDVITGKATKL